MSNKINFFWFRRDLRLHDNTALHHALNSGNPVQCVFVFDKNILSKLEDDRDARVLFIHKELMAINKQLQKYGSSLLTFHDEPEVAWKNLLAQYNIGSIFTNTDYEPYARNRDTKLAAMFSEKGVPFNTFKDHVIFEKSEIKKDDGKPYTVYTPYKNKYLSKLEKKDHESIASEKLKNNFHRSNSADIQTLVELGFTDFTFSFPPKNVADEIIENYSENRNYPGIAATSKLSIHLRFGTISIRELASKAIELKADAYLNELIWRDFYQMILWHFPEVTTKSFKPAYDNIPWRNNEAEFEKWCTGKTGYPIVDAGMRELNETGFMHNRVRMVTASFLVKHLLIDWRWGEAYFAKKLLDFDLASNNGGWQWAAGSGCDAAPYFRIFNPSEQTKKFDPGFKYIRKWVPEFENFTYPAPMVDHKFARDRCLAVFKKALNVYE